MGFFFGDTPRCFAAHGPSIRGTLGAGRAWARKHPLAWRVGALERLPTRALSYGAGVEIHGAGVESADFKLAAALSQANDFKQWIGRLVAYKDEHGHCKVPRSFQTTDGTLLGS